RVDGSVGQFTPSVGSRSRRVQKGVGFRAMPLSLEREPPRRYSPGYWLRILFANVAASIVVVLVFSGVTWSTPPRRILTACGIALLFSCIIGPMLGMVMPRVARAVASRFTFPFDWVILIATMIAIALVGSFAAILVLYSIGYLRGAGIVATWLAGSLKV